MHNRVRQARATALLLACIAMLWQFSASPVYAGSRIALVIGNADYVDAPLRNPVNDARAMANMLERLEFDVIRLENANRAEMEQAIIEYTGRLGQDASGVFYYAGHGVQVKGRNYLVPVGAELESEREVRIEALDLGLVLGELEYAGNRLNIVILDACRNNPFERRFRGRSRGLAAVDAARGALIAYATAPGAVALDGDGSNGVYTEELLRALNRPGLGVEEVFKLVRINVAKRTNSKQVPWESSSLVGEFVFNPSAVPAKTAAGVNTESTPQRGELLFWETIKSSDNVDVYKAYLKQFPNGVFTTLAQIKLKELQRMEAAVAKGDSGYVFGFGDIVRPPQVTESAQAAAPVSQAEQVAAIVTPELASSVEKALEGFKDCRGCPEMIVLPPGSYVMGNNGADKSEGPSHRVNIRRPIAIGKYEVTVSEWNACVADGGCDYKPGQEARSSRAPMRDISWTDAQQYVSWLSQSTGKTYRLPSEAEWEYAARAGTTTDYWWGDKPGRGRANCRDCGGSWQPKFPADVDAFPANPFGLHGISGGVWEWTSDCWFKDHTGAPSDGRSRDKADCRTRVLRGGSWKNDASYARTVSRLGYGAGVRYLANGFRVARDL